MQENYTIGLFGGSFNPVHVGHLILAQDALDKCEINQLLFVPCALPPHKSNCEMVEGSHRIAMLENAIEGDPRFEISSLEMERGGVSYTIDTVRQLRLLYPGANIKLIIGTDMLPELHEWKEIYSLLDLCELAIFQRPGTAGIEAWKEKIKLEKPWPERIVNHIYNGHLIEISSSEVRMRLAEGMSIRYLVPSSVEMYISEHRLYRA